MVLAASGSNELYITEAHLKEANDITTSIEVDMPKVFANIGNTEITRISAEVIALIQAHRKMTSQEVYRKFFDRISITDFELVIQGVIKVGYVKMVQEGGQVMLISTLKPKESVDAPDAATG